MKIRPYLGNRWQADSGMIAGVRLRQVFDTKQQAKDWLAAMAVRKATSKLEVCDIDARTAADAKRAAAILSEKTTLTSAAQFWAENHREGAARHILDLIGDFNKHLVTNNSRPRYIDGMMDTLLRLGNDLHDPMIGDCTTEAILIWLRNPNWSKATFRNRRRELSVFFNWCVRQGILTLNPVARIPSPKLDERKIEVLTVDQTRNLLNGLSGSDRAYFAIAIFAGLRPAEIDRLTWADVKIDRGHIDLRSESSKARARRLVTIQPCLKAWLDPEALEFCREHFPDAPISRCDKNEMMKRACHAAGLDRWPKNICRHSFGSYHLERWRNANETALQMGHSTTAMLYRHYREVVTPEEAEAFWSIFPPGAAGQIVPFPQSHAI